MPALIKNFKKFIRKCGFDVVRYSKDGSFKNAPVELPIEINHVIKRVIDSELTMVSPERLYAVALACKNAALNTNQPASFVECGVWRGGASIVAAFVFEFYGRKPPIHLFDTFEGMTEPGTFDIEIDTGRPASYEDQLYTREISGKTDWCYCSEAEVKANFENFGLLRDGIRLIKGDVMKTLQLDRNLPDSISVLRLDTDWYESTRFELEILVPKLIVGGTLLIDDYGHWNGARKAVDEYIAREKNLSGLQFTDKTGRTSVKIN